MTKESDTYPAFPSPDDGESFPGVTIRDWFAAHAPPIPTIRWAEAKQFGKSFAEADAAWRYEYADAMLREREKTR